MTKDGAPTARKLIVPEVWRRIVKKNERQGGKLWDVLVCDHSVPANDNTYRRARSCPECRRKVQEYADQHARSTASVTPVPPPRRPTTKTASASAARSRRASRAPASTAAAPQTGTER